MNTEAKKILLTGASGFIGSYVFDELLRRGYEVHAVAHSGKLSEKDCLTVHQLDLLDAAAVESFMARERFTHLLHFAWYVGLEAHVHNLNMSWLTTSLHLLECFANWGGKHFLGVGTCAEYEYKYGFMREDETPTNPGTLYGDGKNSLYRMARIYCAKNGLRFQWLRPFNCFGYGDKRSFRLIPSVIASCLRGEDVRISHCLNYKDFLYIKDTARGIVDVFESELTGAVNICSGKPVQLRTIVEEIAKFTDLRGKILWGALPGAPKHEILVGDNSKLCSIGWKQKYDLESGLKETIQEWKQNV